MDIKILRDKLGMTQEEMAGALEVSRPAITQWETGASRPSVDNAWQIIDLAHDHGIRLRLDDILPRNAG